MARIKIKDLPEDTKVSREELKKIKGGYRQPTDEERKWIYRPFPPPPFDTVLW
jgi:hypothetical protein